MEIYNQRIKSFQLVTILKMIKVMKKLFLEENIDIISININNKRLILQSMKHKTKIVQTMK